MPKDWIDKYKGKFDQGWDKLREETFARQKKLGVIPPDAVLTARPDEIPAWDEMPEEMRPIFAREMEVYAGFLEHVDHHLGRLVDTLKDLEILDDTLIYFIIGDNGASAEGTPNGCFNEMAVLNGMGTLETPEFLMSQDRPVRRPGGLQPLCGRLGARDGHALPVDQAGRVALGRHAQRHDRALAERHQGEGRDPQPVPSRHRRRADHPRSRRPAAADHRQQRPAGAARRRQHAIRLQRAKAAERHETQYFEMFCNRGIYHKGWTAVTRHGVPWIGAYKRGFDEDVWELYDTDTDWTQSKDLAKENPKKLAELQRLWLIEATKYSVLPLDDRRSSASTRTSPAGRS